MGLGFRVELGLGLGLGANLLEGRLDEVDVGQYVEDVRGASEGNHHLAPCGVAPDCGLAARVAVGKEAAELVPVTSSEWQVVSSEQ